MRIRICTPEDQAAWDDYVLRHKDGVAYQLFAWKTAVENAYGFECPYFLAEKDGAVCGVMPTTHHQLPFSRGRLVSLPYCDMGGILADNEDSVLCLLEFVKNYARNRHITSIEIRSAVPAHASSSISASVHPEKVRMLLELGKDSDALLKGFKSKLRSQINKTKRDGLAVKMGGKELIPVFYTIFAENMRDLGSPVHSRKWLDNVVNSFGARAICCVVYMPNGSPAAGGILLCHNRTVSVPWASSRRQLNRWNPNMRLYWSLLEYAADAGYDWFDFGRSTPGEGTYRFKEQWGARPQSLFWTRHVIGRNKHSPGEDRIVMDRENDHTRVMGETIIKHLPVSTATSLGSRLRRYISL